MRVLVVCPFIPWPLDTGGKIRTYHLLRTAGAHAELDLRFVREPGQGSEHEDALRALGHPVQFFDRGAPTSTQRWKRPKLERWFHSPTLIEQLRRDVASEQHDRIHLDELLLARTLPRALPIPVIQHHHKLDTVLYDRLDAPSATQRFDHWKLRRLEREGAERTPHHLTCSREDADELHRRYPWLDPAVVPSGFDPGHFSPSPALPAREPHTLLYLGSMSYGPNVDAVEQFCRRALPVLRARHPDLVLEIVGRDPAPAVQALAGPGVRVVGGVPDVRPYLARAACLVVPLRIGGGTRLKIAEALGMATPVVSTRIGAEGLGLTSGEELLLTEGVGDMPSAIEALLTDPTAAEHMATRGRAAVDARFRWDVLGEQLAGVWAAAR